MGWQRMVVAAGDGKAVWLASGIDTPTSSGATLVKMKAPKGAAVFSDPSGMVDSARVAAHRRDGELHTVARVSTIADQNSS
jgi:hypothetical protein